MSNKIKMSWGRTWYELEELVEDIMTTVKTITIESKFHNTTSVLHPKDGVVKARQMKRAYDICCGMNDCSCPITIKEIDGEEVEHNVYFVDFEEKESFDGGYRTVTYKLTSSW